MLAPIVQPAPEDNTATGDTSTFIPQLLTRMDKMQQLMVHAQSNQGGGREKKNNHSTCLPLTYQAATEARQRQPHKPLPYFATKYFWNHRKCAYEGAACNNKAPRHQDTDTFWNKHNGSTYGCTWQGGLNKTMMLNIDNKINLIWKAFKLVVDPLPPPIIAKYNIRALAHYSNSADSHEILNLQPTNIVTWVRLNDNITIYPQLVGHIFLSLSLAGIWYIPLKPPSQPTQSDNYIV